MKCRIWKSQFMQWNQKEYRARCKFVFRIMLMWSVVSLFWRFIAADTCPTALQLLVNPMQKRRTHCIWYLTRYRGRLMTLLLFLNNGRDSLQDCAFQVLSHSPHYKDLASRNYSFSDLQQISVRTGSLMIRTNCCHLYLVWGQVFFYFGRTMFLKF
jgi:hypothetical protein